MIKDINAITPEYMKHRLKEQEEYYKEEIKRLQNKNEELLTLYTTEREVKEDYKSIIKEVRERIEIEFDLSKGIKEITCDTDIYLETFREILEILDKVGDIK